jgi:hypothetical protein
MAYPDSNGFSPAALKEGCNLSMAPVLQYRHPWPHFVPTLTANCARPFFSNSLVLDIPARDVVAWSLMALAIIPPAVFHTAAAGSSLCRHRRIPPGNPKTLCIP